MFPFIKAVALGLVASDAPLHANFLLPIASTKPRVTLSYLAYVLAHFEIKARDFPFYLFHLTNLNVAFKKLDGIGYGLNAAISMMLMFNLPSIYTCMNQHLHLSFIFGGIPLVTVVSVWPRTPTNLHANLVVVLLGPEIELLDSYFYASKIFDACVVISF